MKIVMSLFDQLHWFKIFSKLDAMAGFWQVPLNEHSRKYTAFATPFGLFQYTVMPMGLKNAPAHFQSVMDKLFNCVDFKFRKMLSTCRMTF